mgnify:CR=1 FL=1
MKVRKILCLLLICIPMLAIASGSSAISANEIPQIELTTQDSDKTVRGMISETSGEPLPGVTVQVKGTTRGVLSDLNGYYIVDANPGDVLVFSYVGFVTEEVVVKKSRSLNVTLREDVEELDEVVVVGMGSQRKASVIGSISSVPVGNLRASQRSLTSNLSGRIAGSVAVQRSGEPGQDVAQFWIRGLSTFGANQAPLMLVDGVERDISDISVDEVESVSILKDASATAVYGVRAANGVVLVTTRKGIAQKPVVEFKIEQGFSDLPKMPKYLDGANYARLANEAVGYANYSDEYIHKLDNHTEWTDQFMYPNINWFDQVFNKYSSNTNATLNIQGGSEQVRYFVSAGFLEDNGNLKNWKDNDYKSNVQFKRYNFRSNIDVTLAKNTVVNLEIGANLVDMHQPGVGNREIYGKYVTPAEEIFHWANLYTPLSSPIRVPIGFDGDGNRVYSWGAPSQVGENNPAERLFNSGYNRVYRTQAMSQVVLNQKLPFILDGLKLRASFSFDYNNNTTQNYHRNPNLYSITGLDPDSGEPVVQQVAESSEALRYSRSLSSNRAMEFKLQFMYDKIFNEKHRTSAMVMYYQRDYINGSATESILSLPYRKQGLAARTTYSFDERYFAEFNVGYNGSENFPSGKRFGVFPAGAIGYLISNEKFWNIDAINILKLRASIGLVGNESLAANQRFGYLDIYGGGLGGFNFGETDAQNSSNSYAGVGEQQYGVKNLTWEKGLKKNIGVELKMFDSKISLEMDYFHEVRSDILSTRNTIPGFAGFGGTTVNANIGKVRNHGVDATLEFNDKIGEVDYRLYGNYTFTRNKIRFMDEPDMEYRYLMKTGNRIGQQFGLVSLGLFKDQDDIDSHPSQEALGGARPGDVKYLDYNKDGKVDLDDMIPIGYSNIPEIVYGFGAQFFWKNFDFGVFFRGQDHVTYSLGGSAFIPFSQGIGKGNVYTKALDRWTEDNPNPNAFYPRLSDGLTENNWKRSTRNIYNGRLLRLSDMEIGYTFDKKLIAPLGLKSLRIYAVGNNLALFSKWDMWDPETGSNNGSKYPLSRKINFGIKTTF